MTRRSIFKQTGNPTLETGGVWLTYPTGDETEPRLLLARAGGTNREFQKLATELTAKYRRANIEFESIAIEKQDEISAEIYSRTVVLGWKDIVDDEGNDIPFSPENCKRILQAVPDLLRWVMTEAGKASSFRAQVIEHVAGN